MRSELFDGAGVVVEGFGDFPSASRASWKLASSPPNGSVTALIMRCAFAKIVDT
jgi:hypothetical protein